MKLDLSKLYKNVLFVCVDGMGDINDDVRLRPKQKSAQQRLDIENKVKEDLLSKNLRVVLLNPTDTADIKIPYFRINSSLVNGVFEEINYNFFMLKFLYTYIKHLEFTHIIVFQYDGHIHNINQWDDDFLNYDYMGYCNFHNSVNDEIDYSSWFSVKNEIYGNHMNGGFSLRSRALVERCQFIPMEDFIKLNEKKGYTNEDVLLADYVDMNKMPKKYSIVKKFASYCPSNESFGFHGQCC